MNDPALARNVIGRRPVRLTSLRNGIRAQTTGAVTDWRHQVLKVKALG